MPNNPVQVILNDDKFLVVPAGRKRGPETEFFEDDNVGFVRHKETLLNSINTIIQTVENWNYGPASYLKVCMRSCALAKSYRPNRSLFLPETFPCVGADGVGVLYFRAPLIHLQALGTKIGSAEDIVELGINSDGSRIFKPTRIRSEVGAISSIEIPPYSAKIDFSLDDVPGIFSQPGIVSGYLIELFAAPEVPEITPDFVGLERHFETLQEIIFDFGKGVRAYLIPKIGRTPLVELQLTTFDEPPVLMNLRDVGTRIHDPQTDMRYSTIQVSDIDVSVDRHTNILTKLSGHPLVRAIKPPIQLSPIDTTDANERTLLIDVPTPDPSQVYPVVGVIDSGVAPVMNDWLVDRYDFLDLSQQDQEHGTRVGGLIAFGQKLNNESIVSDPGDCKIFDIALQPKANFGQIFSRGIFDLLEEIEHAVIEASNEHNIRIFNLSINQTASVSRDSYSNFAAKLDIIADKYGVLFVNSAGNLPIQEQRTPWQKKPGDVVKYFANRAQSDTILVPAESVRNLSVGALNPPETNQIVDAPTSFTRRGPGLEVGVKPDLAHYGGASSVAEQSTGLNSMNSSGKVVPVAGTSFSAPLVARTLALLDFETNKGLEPETLRALIIHGAVMPFPLSRRGIKNGLGRQFAGFGKPVGVSRMVETDDHEITLVFQSRLVAGEKRPTILQFPIEWPTSLVDPNSKGCFGFVKVTLVYSPPLDPAFGAEFVRVNLDVSLRQRDGLSGGKPKFKSELKPIYLPDTKGYGETERALIKHGLKWWPTKQYERRLENRGSSTEWRLEVTSLVRAEAKFPNEGVPFSLIFTLRDKEGVRPVYQEMIQMLSSGVTQTVGIREAVRVRSRY